ncbi:MAG TPA: aminotransferase class V-fold PLP-dependent enzyme [Candidatus Limnocylindrales bacterium]|nr:aminotransferase class V-fold PLP-dependent enzyme [Candidatus Limnocylindrales bacterium]
MPSEHAAHWILDPAVTFLNHGSFGATPRPVLEAQQEWRERMEREPVRFMVETLEPELDRARLALASFVGADADDLAFVTNATSGCNAVLRSLRFQRDDELLTIDHAYNAVKTTMEFVAERAGARVKVVDVPFPLASEAELIDPVLAAVTPRTRLAVLDHVTSATALVLPIGRLVAALAERGVDTLVDGAHAPGQVTLDLDALGAAYYTGNLHKWVCAPKGAAFLWVRRDRQAAIRPLTISHGANSPRTDRSRFRLEFDWQGTADPTAVLAVPEALAFGASLLAGGWDALRLRNHDLAVAARDMLCAVTDQPLPAPDGMIGSMAAVPLDWEDSPGTVQGIDLDNDPIHAGLLAAGVQVMVTPWPQRPTGGPWRRLVRVSAAAYNDIGDMRRLANALAGMLEGSR